jgi:uncharacterized damage-inducible protein DinB
MNESLAYPIGQHVRKAEYSAAERAAFIQRLAEQPVSLTVALEDFRDEDFELPYRPGGWTIRQVVHHMADSHMNMLIRVKLALADDEPAIKGYDQDAWVQQADVSTVSPLVSVALIAALHARAVALFGALSPDQFRRGLMHSENGRMTIEQVLALYAWHGDHHVAHVRAVSDRRAQG